MSRSGYSDDGDYDQWATIMWRGAVTSSLRGKRGQAFLRETLAALDALPKPELIANDLAASGAYCTLGAVGHARKIDLSAVIDVEDHHTVAGLFGVPHALACEIMWENDDGGGWTETPRARWERMRRWIIKNLKDDQPVTPATASASIGAIVDDGNPATDTEKPLNNQPTQTPGEGS